jgi:hypothetical protein
MSASEARLVHQTALIISALVVLRLIAAAWTPLTFDEAYYWTWSKHLAGGYYDHPPAVAAIIALGTMIAGDTELGVRLVSILLALPMSWALFRAGSILFDARVGATATILLNVTLMVFWPGDPDLAGERSRSAALADIAVALPGRIGCAGAVFAGHPLECRSPLGFLYQADGPRAHRGFPSDLYCRTDPDADRIRDAVDLDSRRDGALWALYAEVRQTGFTNID